MVQPFGLGTGVLADGVSMGVEPQVGTGASVGTNSCAHDGICSCNRTKRAGCHTSNLICRIRPCRWVWSSHDSYLLENGSLHWTRLRSPARRDAALSSRAIASDS